MPPGRAPAVALPARGPAISISFACVLSQLDPIAEACRALRPDAVAGPRDTPRRADTCRAGVGASRRDRACPASLGRDRPDAAGTLREQRDQVAERIAHLKQLSTGLDRMIEAHERGLLLAADQQAAIFGPGWNPDWPSQAHARWGNSPQWARYAERAATRSPEEWQAIADTTAELDRDLGSAMGAGVTPGSVEANRLVERHREAFTAYFPVTRQMHLRLGRMYEADPAFAGHYNGIRPGLAAWLRRIIDASARAHDIDPDTATWQ